MDPGLQKSPFLTPKQSSSLLQPKPTTAITRETFQNAITRSTSTTTSITEDNDIDIDTQDQTLSLDELTSFNSNSTTAPIFEVGSYDDDSGGKRSVEEMMEEVLSSENGSRPQSNFDMDGDVLSVGSEFTFSPNDEIEGGYEVELELEEPDNDNGKFSKFFLYFHIFIFSYIFY